LKTHVIAAELRRRFTGRTIINVTGVRREESLARSKATVADPEADGKAWSWRPIVDWTTADVFAAIDASGLAPHPAYRTHGMTRVSCRFCIMSSAADLQAASLVPESHDLYRALVDLEIVSSFGFQGQRWLADVAPQLLSDVQRADVVRAKERAQHRIAAEAAVTPVMRYAAGWPQRRLTDAEAGLLADVRRRVSALYGFASSCLDVASIHARYDALLAVRAQRAA
jgi:3'-phosphoadenosine 5'-phosphosulfate sulfotransferase (PAPS reductase)/FAD synthetase